MGQNEASQNKDTGLAALSTVLTKRSNDAKLDKWRGAFSSDLRVLYYMYVDEFHCHPVDIFDLLDGLLFLTLRGRKCLR